MLNFLEEKNPVCPRCNVGMRIEDKKLIEKWVCPNCNGIIFPLFSDYNE